MLDDTALLKQYSRTGDAEAFSQLVQRYARMVYGTCLRITGNPQEAEDIAQECFLELARKSGQVRSSLPGWLHKMARNRALDAIEKTATQKRYETQAAAENTTPPEPSWAEIAPLVDEAVEKLPEKLRAPIILHYFQGLTQAEAASVLGVDRSTVSRNLEKAVAALRAELGKAGVVVTVAALTVLLTDNSATALPTALIAGLGKIAVSGIGSGATVATAGVLGTVAGKVAVVSTSLIACLIVGHQVYTRSVAARGPVSGSTASRQAASTNENPLADWQMEYQDSVTEWLKSISAQDADTLALNRGVEWSYADLKSREPAHAALVDSYLARAKVEFEEEGFGLIASKWVDPQSVAFRIQPGGQYYLRIMCPGYKPCCLLLVNTQSGSKLPPER